MSLPPVPLSELPLAAASGDSEHVLGTTGGVPFRVPRALLAEIVEQILLERSALAPSSRIIATEGGLSGGGDLSADRTLSIADGALALSKLAPVAPSTLLGVPAGDYPATPAALTREQALAALGLSSADDFWGYQPIGVPIGVWTHLNGVTLPPTDKIYRYVLLTAGEDGVGGYNQGILTGESVSGSSPRLTATAVIALPGSPINGRTINLINTERRFRRAGASGLTQDDQLRNHSHNYDRPTQSAAITLGGSTGVITFSSATTGNPNGGLGGDETRPYNIGETAVMRII